ncbi:MAG: phospholipase D-like domain-containing protein, partial [Candidatus Omnitrophota bacterium]
MKLRRLSTIILAAILIAVMAYPATAGKCYEADVMDISGTKYFPAVKETLSKAKKSISLVMYLIELSSHRENLKADQLVDSLIEAKQRGVDVEVILDQNVDFVQRRSKSEWEAKVKSMLAYKRLKEAGVKVRYDEPVRYTHAKAIVIDRNIVILGSTNWTESALSKNNEINALIKSKGLAEEILSYIKTIKVDE